MKKIAVIGGGVNGLSSAVKLAEHFKEGAQVTLISEEMTPNTTGDGSAGLWGPYLCGDTPAENIIKWSKESHDFFLELWRNGLASSVGVCLQPMLRVSTAEGGYPKPVWLDIVFGLEPIPSKQLDELSQDHKRKYTGGYHFLTFTCEPTGLLPYLFQRFRASGGLFAQMKVKSFQDLLKTGSYDMVVNCTGLGSRYLASDEEVKPVRGQVIRVSAPWMYETLLDDSDDGNYIIPNQHNVVLGGTHQENDFSREVSGPDRQFIMTGCANMVPGLKHAKAAKDWVGLRPGRNSVRLELENYVTKKRTVPIIHNYGHGGSGVTLAWGCASDVLQLAKNHFASSSGQRQSKL